jgi:hypothetical protein
MTARHTVKSRFRSLSSMRAQTLVPTVLFPAFMNGSRTSQDIEIDLHAGGA